MRLLPLLLASCAAWSVQTGEPHPQDTLCGQVWNVNARIRPGVGALVECSDAIAALVAQGDATKLVSRWQLYVTSGWVGLDVSRYDMSPVLLDGVTIPSRHAIEIRAAAFPRLLEHELGHANDFEQGRQNERDL